MEQAEERAEMPKGKNPVLDRRTVVNGNANLLRIVVRGDKCSLWAADREQSQRT